MNSKAPVAETSNAPVSSMALARKYVQEFAAAWERGERPQAAVWLNEHAELGQDQSFALDLVYEEYCQRLARDGSVDATAFCEQFPKFKESVAKLLSVHSALGLTDAPYPTVSPWPQIGDELLGFRLRELLGRGTFSRVFLAEDVQLKRQVVVKICRDGQAEATTLARLDHPHIVPIHSAPSDPFLGFTAICLPFQGRATLTQAIAQRKEPAHALSAATLKELAAPHAAPVQSSSWWLNRGAESFESAVIRLGMQLADGLAHAHAAGIIHRDLKPSNVLLAFDGNGLLMDFNLATHEELTPRVGGTLPYMSPEQLAALLPETKKPEPPDPQSDLYSLGVVLYELATGKHPYGEAPAARNRDELTATARELRKRQRQGPPPIAVRTPGITQRLEAILRSCLAFEREDRIASAVALRAALARELRPMRRVARWALRRPLAAATVTLFFMAVLTAGAFAAAPFLFRDDASAGQAALIAGDYAQAQKHLMAAVMEHEEDHDLRLLLGIARFKQQDYEWALQDFLQLRKAAPGLAPAELSGYCSLKLNKGPAMGLHFLEEAQAPLSPESSNNLGYCLLQMPNRLDEAKRLLDIAAESLPNRQAPYVNRIRWAWVASLKRPIDIQALEVDVERAVAIGPDCKELRHSIALAFGHPTRKKEIPPDSLIKHLRRALEMGLDEKLILADPVLAKFYDTAKPEQRIASSSKATPGFEAILEPPLPANALRAVRP